MEKAKTKKFNFSVVLNIVLGVALIVISSLAATGAWFRDSVTQNSDAYTFGEVNIAEGNVAFSTVLGNTQTTQELLMPGSSITATFTIDTTQSTADIWVRLKLEVSGTASAVSLNAGGLTDASDGALPAWSYDGTGGYYYAKLTNTINQDCKVVYTVPTDYEDQTDAGLTVFLTLTIDAVQVANNADGTYANVNW